MSCNIKELMESLNEEERSIFTFIEAHGWVVELEEHKYVFHNYDSDPKEVLDPCEDNEEAIRAARVLYEQIIKAQPTTEATPMTSVADVAQQLVENPDSAVDGKSQAQVTERLRSLGAPEQFKPHELDLRRDIIEELDAKGISSTADAPTSAGTIDLYSEDAVVYEFKCSLTSDQLRGVVERALILRDVVNPSATVVIVACCIDDADVDNLDKLKAAARDQGIEVGSFDYNDNSDTLRIVNPSLQGTGGASTTEDSSILKPEIALQRIRTDGGTQPRAQLNFLTIDEYAQAMTDGAIFPPVILFFDGSEYWLADGFHRFHAALKIGKEMLACDVRQGTRRDAVLYSLGANATHGLPRSNEDKRRAVQLLLDDEEWSQWSDSLIAAKASVSQPFVSKLRRESTQNGSKLQTLRRSADGAVRETKNIGSKPDATVKDSSPPLFDEPSSATQSGEGKTSQVPESSPAPTDAKQSQSAGEPERQTTGDAPPNAEEVVHALHTNDEATVRRAEESAITESTEPTQQPISSEREAAWKKTGIEITIRVFPDDGKPEGRRMFIVAHQEGGAPVTESTRDDVDAPQPFGAVLGRVLRKLREETPALHTVAKTAPATTTPSTSKQKASASSSSKKKPADRTATKSSGKKSGARKSSTKKPATPATTGAK